MPTIVMDLDGTLTLEDMTLPYEERRPNLPVIERLREYAQDGFQVAIYTSRNMRTHGKSIGRINALTIPVIIEWLKKHDVPFNEIHVGKPWAEADGFYVDDRAIRPDEFVKFTRAEIAAITGPALQ